MNPDPTKINSTKKIKTTYYNNGDVMSKIPYVNGKKHGMERMWWYSRGGKWSETVWRNGKKHGLYTEWYEGGQKWYERMWIDDEAHGVATGWWDNGQKSWETMSDDGIGWDEEGNVIKVDFPPVPQKQTLLLNQKNHITP